MKEILKPLKADSLVEVFISRFENLILTGKIAIGQKRHKLVVRVDVIDNGPGIPNDMLETIFYPMVTGHAEGTGLGLSIAQSLVNVHGGIIECSSRPGHTEFTILLPLETIHEQGR